MIQNVEAPVQRNLPGIRKAAILMVILGDQISAEILRQLDEEEVQVHRARSRAHHHHQQRAGRSHSGRVLPDVGGARLRSEGRHRLREENAHQRLRPGARQETDGPAGEDAGLGNGQLRHPAKSRSAAARQVHSQRASPDHRADPLASERLAGRRAADLAAGRSCAPTWRLRMANLDQISPEIISKIAAIIGEEAEIPGRAEPRILRRRAGGVGNVQPAGLGHQQGDSGRRSSRTIPTWWRPSGI